MSAFLSEEHVYHVLCCLFQSSESVSKNFPVLCMEWRFVLGELLRLPIFYIHIIY